MNGGGGGSMSGRGGGERTMDGEVGFLFIMTCII